MLNPEMHLNREGKPTALRDGFGKAIVELAEKQNDVWALTADVAESSRVHWFAEKFPERFVQVGVAEQNLAGVGAGIASCGKVAFISAFGAFNPGRNWDQIRVSVCYNDVPVIVHASHTGITVGPDGASHQVLEDIALTRSLPNMSIFVPCDAEEARKAVFAAYSKRKPAYIRTGREKMPIITTAETPFEIGKANVLRDGSEVVIFACGIEVYHSLQAAEMLEKEGVSVAVVNVHTIKPFDSETVQRYASKCMLAVSVEEHQINGGLGSAVAEAIAEKGGCRLVRHGIQDSFAESGEAPELMKKYKLDADGIYELIKNEL